MADAPPARPEAWFLQRGARRFGPLAREELRGWFAAGMVGAADQVSGPEWDGALAAAEAAARLGCELRASATTAAKLAPAAQRDLVFYEDHDAGWLVALAWAAALFAVQMALMRPHPPGFAAFLGEAAWRYAQVALPCVLLVGGSLWLKRGTRPGPYGPLLAMSAVYAVFGVRAMFDLMAVPATAAVAVEEVAPSYGAGPAEAFPPIEDAPVEAPAEVPPPGIEAPTPVAAPSAPSAVAIAPVSPPVDPDPWQTRAYQLQQAHDWNGLLAHATQWTQAEPDRALAWHVLGSAQRALGRTGAAIASFERAVALGSADVRLLQALALSYYEKGDRQKAIAASRRLLAVDPDSALGHGVLGRAMSDTGEYDEAVAELERATKLAPDKRWYWSSLALAYRRGGYTERAKAAQKKADALR